MSYKILFLRCAGIFLAINEPCKSATGEDTDKSTYTRSYASSGERDFSAREEQTSLVTVYEGGASSDVEDKKGVIETYQHAGPLRYLRGLLADAYEQKLWIEVVEIVTKLFRQFPEQVREKDLMRAVVAVESQGLESGPIDFLEEANKRKWSWQHPSDGLSEVQDLPLD